LEFTWGHSGLLRAQLGFSQFLTASTDSNHTLETPNFFPGGIPLSGILGSLNSLIHGHLGPTIWVVLGEGSHRKHFFGTLVAGFLRFSTFLGKRHPNLAGISFPIFRRNRFWGTFLKVSHVGELKGGNFSHFRKTPGKTTGTGFWAAKISKEGLPFGDFPSNGFTGFLATKFQWNFVTGTQGQPSRLNSRGAFWRKLCRGGSPMELSGDFQFSLAYTIFALPKTLGVSPHKRVTGGGTLNAPC